MCTRTLGLPFGGSIVAAGLRLELIPTGYGPGGAAVVCTQRGHRTLVLGPTTAGIEAQPAHRLVLLAPALVKPDDQEWLEAVRLGAAIRLVVPDAGAAAHVSGLLTAAGIAHRRPTCLGSGARGPREATNSRVVVSASSRGGGLEVDGRPQADEAALVAFARATGAEEVYVHGPRAEAVSARLRDAGSASRVLEGPRQLSFAGLTPGGA